jgi:hypothetical protein
MVIAMFAVPATPAPKERSNARVPLLKPNDSTELRSNACAKYGRCMTPEVVDQARNIGVASGRDHLAPTVQN